LPARRSSESKEVREIAGNTEAVDSAGERGSASFRATGVVRPKGTSSRKTGRVALQRPAPSDPAEREGLKVVVIL
jgi:hypothetical protein